MYAPEEYTGVVAFCILCLCIMLLSDITYVSPCLGAKQLAWEWPGREEHSQAYLIDCNPLCAGEPLHCHNTCYPTILVGLIDAHLLVSLILSGCIHGRIW